MPQLSSRRIPVIHTTDLHHTPNDPDDHFDLAALYALPELDLKAIILDYSEAAFGTTIYEPGYVPVAQLNFLTGRAVPAAVGPSRAHQLSHPEDPLSGLSPQESAGIRLLLESLRACTEPAFITVTGSCRSVAAAYNREPELFHERVRAIVLNAGAPRPKLCYNVKLDPHAMRCIVNSGLPIWWFPCVGNEGFHNLYAPNNTHFVVPYSLLLSGLDERLLNWCLYALWGNLRGDIIRALHEANRYEIFNERTRHGQRNMFCTASFALMADRQLLLGSEGWRFSRPGVEAPEARCKPLRLRPVTAHMDDEFFMRWAFGTADSRVHLFEREPGEEENHAMGEALNGLLRDLSRAISPNS